MGIMIKSSKLQILVAILLLSSCNSSDDIITAKFSETPVNLVEFNTEYDDYNSTAPTLGETFPFCFSSNRTSQGGNFDIVYKLMSIAFDKDSKELDIYNNTNGNLDVVRYNQNINIALGMINTSSNEFGPYLIPMGLVIVEPQTSNRYESYIMLYSTDVDQHQDIKFTHNLEGEHYIPPIDLVQVNSDFDDCYPSINSEHSRLYFSSNRAGNYNIYSHNIEGGLDLIDNLTNTTTESVIEQSLSTSFDDTCPFVLDNIMVFASNREGGYGGYDLYYSLWDDNKWLDPINFGEEVNSELDEFRPIVRKEGEFENDIMIFSSNRSGGKGGFDLYYVGIDMLRI